MLEPHLIKKRIYDEGKQLKGEMQERAVTYIAAGLGLVAGLAWNDAIQSFINEFLPNNGRSVWAKFLYAVIVTGIVVVVTVYLNRLFQKKQQ